MARIKILELPTQVLGEEVTTPFIFIIDQLGDDGIDAALDSTNWDALKEGTGASMVLASTNTLDIDRE